MKNANVAQANTELAKAQMLYAMKQAAKALVRGDFAKFEYWSEAEKNAEARLKNA
jgi:hypothetical protein